ncbi:MAG: hypothetical protein BWY42_00846 [Candidatus Omnitrophica bacterium ADurb.Bin277]|nr:MAG: hypothetical protein BWY42_00846 [Candidatus Omnitrophica bacterium ADurb.Bin277]
MARQVSGFILGNRMQHITVIIGERVTVNRCPNLLIILPADKNISITRVPPVETVPIDGHYFVQSVPGLIQRKIRRHKVAFNHDINCEGPAPE